MSEPSSTPAAAPADVLANVLADEPRDEQRSAQEQASTGQAGHDALLDIEVEARIQFGAREMTLAELLELSSGDVLELDRLVSDPVDLLVGDKIVARGEVVVVGGNFGLQVLEVLEAKPRLESVRCLP